MNHIFQQVIANVGIVFDNIFVVVTKVTNNVDRISQLHKSRNETTVK